jgi:hypothetical protein
MTAAVDSRKSSNQGQSRQTVKQKAEQIRIKVVE